MTCVIPDMNPTRPAQLDPRKAVAQIRQFGVTNMFGSPAVIRRMGEWGETLGRTRSVSDGVDSADAPRRSRSGFATLRRVISAGAPASAAAIERFARLLPPSAEVFTPYGATEALPVANIGSRTILEETRALTEQGKGVCVGRPVSGMEVRVVPISDEPIPEWSESLALPAGEIGEFVVRGPVVTRRYFNRPEATKLAKIRDPKTGEVLHRMGDVGYIDEQGRLWFCGRKSHRVVTPHGTLYTDMVEPIFNTVPGVARTALVGVTRNGVTYPVLCLEVDGDKIAAYTEVLKLHGKSVLEDSNRIWVPLFVLLLRAAQRFPHTQQIHTFLPHHGFPVDVRHNSKIFREKLAVWADKRLGKDWRPEAHPPRVGAEASP
jgi:acyl-CoA synthetase (AMP-forming)/AMP-acid ligase II